LKIYLYSIQPISPGTIVKSVSENGKAAFEIIEMQEKNEYNAGLKLSPALLYVQFMISGSLSKR